MPEMRIGLFPQDGDIVQAQDHSRWRAEVNDTFVSWHQLEPAKFERPANADQLAEAHRVWAQLWSGAATVRTVGPPQETDTPHQLAELVARAALTDALSRVCDGRAVGAEEHVRAQIRAIVGEAEYAFVFGLVDGARDRDRNPPGTFSDQLRVHVTFLSQLAGRMPANSTARAILTALLQGEPYGELGPRELPHRLFRELVSVERVELTTAEQALSSASCVVAMRLRPLEP